MYLFKNSKIFPKEKEISLRIDAKKKTLDLLSSVWVVVDVSLFSPLSVFSPLHYPREPRRNDCIFRISRILWTLNFAREKKNQLKWNVGESILTDKALHMRTNITAFRTMEGYSSRAIVSTSFRCCSKISNR